MKPIRTLLALCLFATAAPLWAQTQIFDDVPVNDTRWQTTALMYERGITSGCSVVPSLYCANDYLTRGSASVFVIRAVYGSGQNFSFPSTPYFTDVPATHPQFAYIQKMKEWGITNGCGTGIFCPDDSIPNWQVATFVVKARNMRDHGSLPALPLVCNGGVMCSNVNVFASDPSSNYGPNHDWIERAYQLVGSSIVPPGCPAGTFCTDTIVARGQVSFGVAYGILGLPPGQTLPQWESSLPPINGAACRAFRWPAT